MADAVRQRRSLRPVQVLAGSFLLLILAGSSLLMLPHCQTGVREVTYLDALFTATSAVCVTGLVVVDTSTTWTELGQFVILVLIQFGGIGVVSFGALFAMLLGQRIRFRQRELLKEQYGQLGVVGILQIIPVVAITTLTIESLGAILLLPVFVPEYGTGDGIWHAIFHSISAFCNAGFSTLAGNLERYSGNVLVNLDICALIVIGGIGFPVIAEILERRGRKRLSLHSRVVFRATAMLILYGATLLFIIESFYTLSFNRMPLHERILASLFQSVTSRTAGYNTIPIGGMAQASQFVLILLMFIGGSPSGTAGGVKTTTFVAGLAAVRSVLRGETEVTLLDRRLERNNVRRALVLMLLALMTLILAILAMFLTGGGDLLKLLFEAVSAFGTVGLSTGITPLLSSGQRIVIILLMYIGRLGPMTFTLALARPRPTQVRYAETQLLTG